MNHMAGLIFGQAAAARQALQSRKSNQRLCWIRHLLTCRRLEGASASVSTDKSQRKFDRFPKGC